MGKTYVQGVTSGFVFDSDGFTNLPDAPDETDDWRLVSVLLIQHQHLPVELRADPQASGGVAVWYWECELPRVFKVEETDGS